MNLTKETRIKVYSYMKTVGFLCLMIDEDLLNYMLTEAAKFDICVISKLKISFHPVHDQYMYYVYNDRILSNTNRSVDKLIDILLYFMKTSK